MAKLYEIMDNICLAYDNISLSEYIELLEYGIKEITVDTVPAKLNQVEVVDINRSRGIEKKIAYLIGCYDGGLPTVQSEDNIFTDIELEKLKLVGIDLEYEIENKIKAIDFIRKNLNVDEDSIMACKLFNEIKSLEEELVKIQEKIDKVEKEKADYEDSISEILAKFDD